MDRLTAEESMRESTRISVGTGALSADALRTVRAMWVRAAGGGVARRARVSPSVARAIGVGVTLVTKKDNDPRG